jgi:hypothetical protein
MNLKSVKFELPAGWREVSRSGNENQLIVRVCHVNPLSHVDPKIFQDQPISSGPKSSVSKLGVSLPSGAGGPTGDFFKAMKAFIESGFAPAYMTIAWLDDLHKKMTQTPGAEIPDEADLAIDVSIVQYQTKEMAEQSFKNYGSFPMAGFGMPAIGASASASGAKTPNFMDLLEGDALKQYVSKEQLEKMRATAKEMKEKMKEQMPKLQEAMKKAGLQYKEGKYLGYRAIFSEMANPVPPPKPIVPVKRDKNAFHGGGSRGNNVTIPLPKVVQLYSKTMTTCQAILIKNFVVTGGLLNAASLLSPGNTPCYSLTKTEERSDTVEGIHSTYIIASASNYAQEGYLNKEGAEKALQSILSKVESLR